jgi:SOS-response transcriptional repressor LexA
MKLATDRQLAVLRLITDSVVARGFSPSLREMRASLGHLAMSAVNGHVAALKRKGYLGAERSRGRSRLLVPTDLGWDAVGIERPRHVASAPAPMVPRPDDPLRALRSSLEDAAVCQVLRPGQAVFFTHDGARMVDVVSRKRAAA